MTTTPCCITTKRAAGKQRGMDLQEAPSAQMGVLDHKNSQQKTCDRLGLQ